MKKGFVFTLVFSAFFLMFLYAAGAYINILQMRQAVLDSADPAREVYFADDVGYDYLSIWGMRPGLSRDSTKAYLTVSDRIPNKIGDLETKISDYENFVSGDYSRANNIKAKAELDRTGELDLEPQKISYRHSSRNDIVVEGNALEYRISAKLSKACSSGA